MQIIQIKVSAKTTVKQYWYKCCVRREQKILCNASSGGRYKKKCKYNNENPFRYTALFSK